jgi:hypothetical protein
MIINGSYNTYIKKLPVDVANPKPKPTANGEISFKYFSDGAVDAIIVIPLTMPRISQIVLIANGPPIIVKGTISDPNETL